jgi:hypothetical protein
MNPGALAPIVTDVLDLVGSEKLSAKRDHPEPVRIQSRARPRRQRAFASAINFSQAHLTLLVPAS